ncbi:hypothetical protein BKA82DRAFT_1007943 [Pisolithus tinctorius]|uniref:Uncharacterized protein n=1 Tax=Pisolithus tinctorius Marx 270 TaxID=870435 RepID=A0A0C3ID21_PISTI|nr:hypothetical protein BKA82DRAFT_1007943 [Pisolithus tinctorius]KIN94932.1 hypothetical protein M404DRAFT_1007943 [Pisolithus tinctorius Marx 270]
MLIFKQLWRAVLVTLGRLALHSTLSSPLAAKSQVQNHAQAHVEVVSRECLVIVSLLAVLPAYCILGDEIRC